MAKKRDTPEQVINKLREAEVAIAEGSAVAEAARRTGVTEQTFYRWRSEYGGLRIDQARRLKRLELENIRYPDAARCLTDAAARAGRRDAAGDCGAVRRGGGADCAEPGGARGGAAGREDGRASYGDFAGLFYRSEPGTDRRAGRRKRRGAHWRPGPDVVGVSGGIEVY